MVGGGWKWPRMMSSGGSGGSSSSSVKMLDPAVSAQKVSVKQTFGSVPVFKLSIANNEEKIGSVEMVLNDIVSAAEIK